MEEYSEAENRKPSSDELRYPLSMAGEGERENQDCDGKPRNFKRNPSPNFKRMATFEVKKKYEFSLNENE